MAGLEKLADYIDDLTDSFKIRVELFKHLATLSSGSIVVIAAFIRDLPPDSSKFMLATALILFVLTILFAAWASFYTLGYIIVAKKYTVGVESAETFIKIDKGRWIGVMPFFFFILGMAFLVMFALSAI